MFEQRTLVSMSVNPQPAAVRLPVGFFEWTEEEQHEWAAGVAAQERTIQEARPR